MSLKQCTWITLALIITSYYAFVAAKIPYVDSDLVYTLLKGLYIFLVCTVFYYVYLKKNSPWHITIVRSRVQKHGIRGLQTKLLGFILVMISPLIFVYVLNGYLGVINNYIAKKPFNETVIVSNAHCAAGRQYPVLELAIHNDITYKQPYLLSLPYHFCTDDPDIENMKNQSIQLYGRESTLGRIFEGYSVVKGR